MLNSETVSEESSRGSLVTSVRGYTSYKHLPTNASDKMYKMLQCKF